MIVEIVSGRKILEESLAQLNEVVRVHPSDANFLLVEFNQAKQMYDYLVSQGIVVRDRSNVFLCDNCLRITVGTSYENELLVNAIIGYNK